MAINISVDGMSYKGISSINYKGKIITLSEMNKSTPDKNKTVLASNYMPNGETFYRIFDIDKDNDTIFLDVVIPKNPLVQNVFTLVAENQDNQDASLIQNVTEWAKHGQLHLYAPKNDQLQFENHDCRTQNIQTCEIVSVPCSSDNHYLIAINTNGCYCNGQFVCGDWNNNNFTFIGKLKQGMSRCIIGSKEGATRSYATYNEISLMHKLYTADELETLTKVR